MQKAIPALGLAVVFCLPFQASAQAAASPVCLYASRSYSEGANLCVQRGLMMTCAAGDRGPVWKIAAEFGALCGAPFRPTASRPTVRKVRATLPPPAGGNCFSFAGKRYCE